MEEKFKKILKVLTLALNAQCNFDHQIKDKAAQILGYEDYERLANFWYEEEDKSFKEIVELFDSI